MSRRICDLPPDEAITVACYGNKGASSIPKSY